MKNVKLNPDYVNWVTKRGLRPLNYQNNAIEKVTQSMAERAVTVLAACPSAGKTSMVTYLMEQYLKQNPTHKVLVLAHGQTTLRSQFYETLENTKPDFTYKLIESCDDYDSSTAQVDVALPQSLRNCKIKKTDLLVVDEAHEFYFVENTQTEKVGMVKNIIKKGKVKKQILLTGTPSKFILHGFHIVPVTVNTIFDEGMVNDIYVEVATSNYDFTLKDFNAREEILTDRRFHKKETETTLDEVLKKLVNRLRSFKSNEYTNIIPDWPSMFFNLKKTMIACKSQHQAKQVKEYFDNLNIESALSISDTDVDSLEIERFKDNDNVRVLIVVGRGILGFNLPTLVNVIDMTMSKNIDRIYQLLCRVIRVHPNGDKKLFLKVAPHTLSDYYKYVMTGVGCLNDEYYFTHFNGRNFNDMKLPVRRRPTEPGTGGTSGGGGGTRNRGEREFQPVEFEGLPMIDFFKDTLHKKNTKLSVISYVTFRDVRREFMDVAPNGYWTFEKCLKIAKKFNTPAEWRSGETRSYSSALQNGWYFDCCTHMEVSSRRTKEECIEAALKCKTLLEWRTNYPHLAQAAKKYGWHKECTKHMIVLREKWTKKKCLDSAKKFNHIKDWQNEFSGAYTWARKKGIFEECTQHMVPIQKPKGYWTKEKCLEDALKYTGRREWQRASGSAYNISRKNGWYKECTQHMGFSRESWTLEKCLKYAKRYKRSSDWSKGHNKSYASAITNGWIKECTKHMKNKTMWTKKTCLIEARKYSSISLWQKYSGSSVNFARKNGIMDECTAHMKRKYRKPKK